MEVVFSSQGYLQAEHKPINMEDHMLTFCIYMSKIILERVKKSSEHTYVKIQREVKADTGIHLYGNIHIFKWQIREYSHKLIILKVPGRKQWIKTIHFNDPNKPLLWNNQIIRKKNQNYNQY